MINWLHISDLHLRFTNWALEIGNDTLASFSRWYIPFAIIGLAIGVVRLIRDNIFTLQNGFFNIPVIRDKAKQEKGYRQ